MIKEKIIYSEEYDKLDKMYVGRELKINLSYKEKEN